MQRPAHEKAYGKGKLEENILIKILQVLLRDQRYIIVKTELMHQISLPCKL